MKHTKRNRFITTAVLVIILLYPLYMVSGKSKSFIVGETLEYDVTFGGLLKGNAKIKFYGKVATYTKRETVTVFLEDAVLDSTLEILTDTTSGPESDSIFDNVTPDTLDESDIDSLSKPTPLITQAIKTTKTNIYYITYETKFIGNIYNLHADIYAMDGFFPLLIETEIKRGGNISSGRELFFPDKKMAIFTQTIENKEEIDTLIRNNPLQDITTIPFYFMGKNIYIGAVFNVSLAQGEYKLTSVALQRLEFGEGFDYRLYETYRVESEPKGFKIWLNKKNNVPIKVYIDYQKIRMVLRKRSIDASVKQKTFNEDTIKSKLTHVFP